jgi:hypothetical protein
MQNVNLILTLPSGMCVATSLGIEGLAGHYSPGSGQVFRGRAIFIDLKIKDRKPAFAYRDEGGWRDARGDTELALAEVQVKRTKTALSNNAFSLVPMEAFDSVWLVRTGGNALRLDPADQVVRFASHDWRSDMKPVDIAALVGLPHPATREPRCYMVLGPAELVILTNLSPAEYAWYATHCRGKQFRQVIFTEIVPDPRQLMAEKSFEAAHAELVANSDKKTKTIYYGSAYGRVPFRSWIGYDARSQGGLYVADHDHVAVFRFPGEIPRAWDRADG